MRTMAVRVALAAAVAAAAMGTVIAATVAEDDLAVVKRAVQEPGERTDDAAAVDRRDAAPRSALSARDLRWFKVRITEKGAKKARVNVNLPIALVRALGDDFPIDIGRHVRGDEWSDRSRRDRRDVIRLGDVLATLEAGQSLVEIDDDDATVRVWVE